MAEDFDTLLALLRRTTDESGWLQPQLDDPDSAAVLGARIAIMARLGRAVLHNAAQATISDASGGQPGTSTITVSRTSGATTGTIPQGYAFRDARGALAISQLAIVVGAGQLTKTIPVQTLRKTELVNTEDDPVYAVDLGSPSIPASSGVLIAPVGTAGMTASTFQTIGPSTPITGGAADYLSVHGAERGVYRQPGEDEAAYRQRIRNIPDVVSPIAIGDTVQAASQRPGLPPFIVLEPFSDGATPALKTLHGLGNFDGLVWDGTRDFYDDPRELSGLTLLDRRTATAYFEIHAQDFVRDADGFSFFFDDGFFDDPVLGFAEAVVSFPPAVLAALLAILTDVAAKKAGGVNVDMILRTEDLVVDVGTTTSGAFTEVATLTPAGGTIWMVAQVFAGHDSAAPISGSAHRIVFDLEDGSTFQPPDFTQTWTERVTLPSQRVTAIHGFARSNGVDTLNLVVDAQVLAVTT